ncbi:MAG: DUF4387 domain-containing protein [Silicimonas sp.]|nr:DUF4387 domain-containing protein [Silicimonas sp.]
MPEVRTIVEKVRSKNAGPFWVTIDIFCGTPEAFARIAGDLRTSEAARVLGVPTQELKRFDIAELNVVKLSAPRPAVQGTIRDRDMHGAAWAVLIAGIDLP